MRLFPRIEKKWIILICVLFGLILTFCLYSFFIQSPALSKREVVFAFIVWGAFVPAIYILLSSFIIPRMRIYSPRGRFGWLLLSALIGLLAVLVTLKVPYFIWSLPKQTIEIRIPAGEPDRSVTLQWITTSLGDIGFSQLEQEGEWQRTDAGLIHIGASPAVLVWHGRTGDSAQIVFSSNPTAGFVSIVKNGIIQGLNLSTLEGTPVKAELSLPFNPFNRILVIFSLWFSISFLFLSLTLFLVLVPLRIGPKTGSALEKIENSLHPLNSFLYPKPGKGWWQGRDWFVISVFFLAACLFFLGRWNGLKPFVDLKGDAAYVTAYAASLDHPKAFVGDPLFNDPENFGYNDSLQVLVLRRLNTYIGDYGTAYIILLLPFIFLQLSGFYILGRVFFHSRFFSFLLAILTTILIDTQSWDYWGVYYDPQPRMMFQSVLPWLLTLVILSIQRPHLRWLVFICLGIMIYLHPVSIPSIAFAIWIGYLIVKPEGLKWGRHLCELTGFGLVFLFLTIPFLSKYIENRDLVATVQVDYDTAIAFLKETFIYTYRLQITLANFVKDLLQTGLLPLAYLGAIFLFRSERERPRFYLVLAWIAGILFVSIGVSALEQQIEFRLRILPLFVDMARGLRFLIPLLELIILWPMALGWESSRAGTDLAIVRRLALSILGIIVLIFLNLSFPNSFEVPLLDYRFKTISCISQWHLTCPSQTLLDQEKVIEYIRSNTPEGSRLISLPPADIGGAIRFQALRSESFDPRDMIRLTLGNLAGAIKLRSENAAWEIITSLPADKQLQPFLEFAAGRNTDFAVIKSPAPDWLASKVVYSNATYSLLDLR
jgi:hypothetical protein